MAEVVCLYNGEIIDNREASADTVTMLRGWLERAEAGEIVGAVVVVMYADETVAGNSAGDVNTLRVLGSLEVAKHRIMTALS